MKKLTGSTPFDAFPEMYNELIDHLDRLAEATIKETRWGSAPFHWAREWQKARSDDE